MNVKTTYKYTFILLFLLVFVISSFTNVYSTCLTKPSYVEVFSGGYNLGKVPYDDLGYFTFYIKKNIDTYPIKLNLYFDEVEDDCYSAGDVQMKLFSTGVFVNGAISSSNNITTAKFVFDLATDAPNDFTSTYQIKNKDSNSFSSGSIDFSVDENDPTFLQLPTVSPQKDIYSLDEEVTIGYSIEDSSGSGLKKLTVNGYPQENKDFNISEAHNVYTKTFKDNLTKSSGDKKIYTFEVEDILGNKKSYSLNLTVDDTAPQISNLETVYSTGSTRNVDISVIVEDDSFEIVSVPPEVYGNFSSINPSYSDQKADCTKDSSSVINNKYTCKWTNIPITNLDQTSIVNINIKASDSLGNTKTESFSKEIMYDTQGPNIISFYLENSVGEKNIFSAINQKNTIVYLEFEDESDLDAVSIIKNFDGVDNLDQTMHCNTTSNKRICTWNITDQLGKYSGEYFGETTFSVNLRDKYSNIASKSINVTFDNKRPQITHVEMIEHEPTSDAYIKDGIIESGEKINFKIKFTDENIKIGSGTTFIYGDFYNIEKNTNTHKKSGTCEFVDSNENEVECSFDNIIVRNGYVNTNVTFVVKDKAGNVDVNRTEIEILKRGDESEDNFFINDINITNVINRNLLWLDGGQVASNDRDDALAAWFEGEIQKREGTSDDIKLINYEIKECNSSDPLPLIVSDYTLYPEQTTIFVDNSGQNGTDFVLKAYLSPVSTVNTEDILTNNKSMRCSLALLKRDNETIYSPEIVEFKVNFAFYALPHDNLLKAHASSILDTIDDVDWLGGWFDNTYKVYDTMNKVCTGLNTVQGITSTVSTIGMATQAGLEGIPILGPISDAIGKATHLPNNAIGLAKDYGPIKMMCDFVTCRNGGLLGSFWEWDDRWLDKFNNKLPTSNLCSSDPIRQKTEDKGGK